MKDTILEEILTLTLDNLKSNSTDLSDFDSGRMMAYYEILSLAKEQADLLGVTFADDELNNVIPEDLLKIRRKAA